MDRSAGEVYPVLPLRDIVVFPHMIVPLFVGREKSVRALEDVMKDDKQILLIAQRNAADDDPSSDDIYEVGTISTVLQLLKLPDGTVKVLVEGVARARVIRFSENDEFFEVYADVMPEKESEEVFKIYKCPNAVEDMADIIKESLLINKTKNMLNKK